MIITTDKPMRPRDGRDFYPTPRRVCQAAIDRYVRPIVPGPSPRVLDPGAGAGPWGWAVRAAYPAAHLFGIDLNFGDKAPDYDAWQVADYLDPRSTAGKHYDLVIGNPPYRLTELFIRRGLADLTPGGVLLFLLRLAFLEGQARVVGLWAEYPPDVVSVLARRPSFTDDGKTDATAYALFRWRAGYTGPTTLEWIDWKAESASATQGSFL